MTTPPPQQTPALPHQAAKLSWVFPVIVFLLLTATRQVADRVTVELIALLLILVGFVLGVIALFGMRKYGPKGILAQAMVGIVINGLLLFIFITNFLAARARAQQRTEISLPPGKINQEDKEQKETASPTTTASACCRTSSGSRVACGPPITTFLPRARKAAASL